MKFPEQTFLWMYPTCGALSYRLWGRFIHVKKCLIIDQYQNTTLSKTKAISPYELKKLSNNQIILSKKENNINVDSFSFYGTEVWMYPAYCCMNLPHHNEWNKIIPKKKTNHIYHYSRINSQTWPYYLLNKIILNNLENSFYQ